MRFALTEREYSSGYEIFPVGNVTEKTVSANYA